METCLEGVIIEAPTEELFSSPKKIKDFEDTAITFQDAGDSHADANTCGKRTYTIVENEKYPWLTLSSTEYATDETVTITATPRGGDVK